MNKSIFKRPLVIVLLALLALVGAGLAWSWAPERSVDSLKARWATAPSKFINVQGMQVHVRDEGPITDPEPIVLLHGTSASLHTWDGWVAALSGQRRVIRMDLPAFGLTGPSPSGHYTPELYVDFVRALLDAIQVQKAVVAGNSLGGEIAWMLAVAHPARVSRLILVDAAGYPIPMAGMPIGFKIAQYPILKPIVANTLPRQMIESSVRSVYGHPDRVTPALIDRYYELTLRAGNRAALFDRFADSAHGRHAPEIRKVSQPTLVIWGMRDRLITPDHADRFLKDIPNSRAARFEALGHVPQEEDPIQTVSAVKAFLGMAP
jgi:pimeloyl-ACP methyl ester carboxylesterase